jgi:NAD(P)-dependent dehydrogenase (short-subunit alcohol dehydrogenase family)
MNPPINIVAGAGAELGRAVVVTHVGSGYAVVAGDRREDRLTELPDGGHQEVADVPDPSVVKPLIERIGHGAGAPGVTEHILGAFVPTGQGPVGGHLRMGRRIINRFDCNLEGSVILSQLGVIGKLEAALEH